MCDDRTDRCVSANNLTFNGLIFFFFHSRMFSSAPHLAASPRDVEMAGIIKRLWEQYGFEVELPTYEVLLSYPKKNTSNKVQIINQTGHAIFEVCTLIKQEQKITRVVTVYRVRLPVFTNLHQILSSH